MNGELLEGAMNNTRDASPSRFELNAALHLLVSGESQGWQEAARMVIRAFHKERDQRKRVRVGVKVVCLTKDPPITGYTAEHGNVTADSDRVSETGWSAGMPEEERIGEYKVTQQGDGVLSFCHFRDSDLARMLAKGEPPPIYRLEYDPKSLEPISVGRVVQRDAFRFGPFHVQGLYYVVFNSVKTPPEPPRRLGSMIMLGKRPT